MSLATRAGNIDRIEIILMLPSFAGEEEHRAARKNQFLRNKVAKFN